MAIKKYIDIEVNTKQAVKSLDDLGGTFEDVYGEIQPLNTVIGELEDRLYQMAGNGEQATEEFKLLSKQVGDYKKVIIDTDLAIDSMAQTTAQNLGGALGGVTAGFELGAGAMGAMGVEAEVVEAQLLKVQSAMAIAQGVQGIKEAIPSFKALTAGIMKTALAQKALTIAQGIGAVATEVLNAVMNSNPILLLITAVAGLAYAYREYTNVIADVEEMNEKLNDSLERQNNLLDKTIAKIRKSSEQRLRQLELDGASEKVLHEERLRQIEEENLIRKAQVSEVKFQVEEKSKILKLALKHDDKELAESTAQEIKDIEKKYEDLRLLDGDYLQDKQAEEKKYQETVNTNREKDVANYKAYAEKKKAYDEKRLQTKREIEDKVLELQADTEVKEQELNVLKLERYRADTLKNTELTESEKTELIALAEEEAWQKRKEIANKYKAIDDEELKVAQEFEALKKQTELEELEARLAAEQEIYDRVRDEQLEKDKAAAEQKKAITSAGLDSAMASLESLQSLNELVTQSELKNAEGNEAKQEEIRKKSFERNKKLQIAMAVISGVQGVINALTAQSTIPEPFGTILKVASAAAIGATTAVNIAKIKASTYQGGGGGGASASITSAPRMPSFNIVGNSPQNQLAQSLGGQEQEPIKTYVVSGEVSTAQSLDRNRVKTASL